MAVVLAIIYLIPGILAALFGKKYWLDLYRLNCDIGMYLQELKNICCTIANEN
jgi:hypothetical protein